MDMMYRAAWRSDSGKRWPFREACIQSSTGINQDMGPDGGDPGGRLQWSRNKYYSSILLSLTEPQCPHLQSGKIIAPTAQFWED